MPQYTIDIDDPDALEAMNHVIAANNDGKTPEQYLSEFCTLRHAEMREGQLVNAAMAKVRDDPALKAFLEKKAAKEKVEADALAAEAALKESI